MSNKPNELDEIVMDIYMKAQAYKISPKEFSQMIRVAVIKWAKSKVPKRLDSPDTKPEEMEFVLGWDACRVETLMNLEGKGTNN